MTRTYQHADDQFYTPADAKGADLACRCLEDARKLLADALTQAHYARCNESVLSGDHYDELNALGADMDAGFAQMIERLNAAIARWERECA